MIWCVEDDSGIREIEVYTLNSTGFEARGFADGASFREALETETPELVLLDVMLPGEDGVSLLRYLRQMPRTREVPVIMATAKGMEYDKIQSLDMGADDYLVKPFGMMEMVSRVKAVLRRCAPGLTVSLASYEVTYEGKPVEMPPKELEVLYYLASHPNMVFTRDQLFNDVWGADYVGETRTVDMHIRTLRQKLGKAGAHITTVRGVGYRWEETI